MSLYYGAAGTSAAANAALARANTTGSGSPNVFMFGYVPRH
ncbi:hypothetical protein [Nonomuraea sp. 10N515B]